jgi:hypothetical protein
VAVPSAAIANAAERSAQAKANNRIFCGMKRSDFPKPIAFERRIWVKSAGSSETMVPTGVAPTAVPLPRSPYRPRQALRKRPLGQPDLSPPGLKISPKSGPATILTVGTSTLNAHQSVSELAVRLSRHLSPALGRSPPSAAPGSGTIGPALAAAPARAALGGHEVIRCEFVPIAAAASRQVGAPGAFRAEERDY